MKKNTQNPHSGSDFDDFLKEEGIHAAVEAVAVKRVLARQIERAMKERKISKMEMAARMSTSRSALDRLLDPKNASVTLYTLEKAAAVLDKKLQVKIS